MKNRNGFTLVELLAVIAILAILVVMLLPSVIDIFQESKIGTFKIEIQQIMRQAESTWVLDGGGSKTYCACIDSEIDSSKGKSLSLQGADLNYVITIDGEGRFTNVSVSNTDYAFSNSVGDNKMEKVIASKIEEEKHIFASGIDTQATNYNAGYANSRYCCKKTNSTN